MTDLRYVARQVKFTWPRWQVWDTLLNKPFAPYNYRSKHKANHAADKLNGHSTREADKYRIAKYGSYHGEGPAEGFAKRPRSYGVQESTPRVL